MFQEILQKSLQSMPPILSSKDDNALFCATLSAKGQSHKLLVEFVGTVCDLSWKLNFQKPQMMLKTPELNAKYSDDGDVQTMFNVLAMRNGGGQSSGELRVDYALEPTLIHGDEVKVLGRVKLCQS